MPEKKIKLPNIVLNDDTTMLNSTGLVTVLFGKYVESAQQSPFRPRMRRLCEMADIPFEVVQSGSANAVRRGRSELAVTLESAQKVYAYAGENGLLVPASLLAATRMRGPATMADTSVQQRMQELEEEVRQLRAQLREGNGALHSDGASV